MGKEAGSGMSLQAALGEAALFEGPGLPRGWAPDLDLVPECTGSSGGQESSATARDEQYVPPPPVPAPTSLQSGAPVGSWGVAG